MPRRPAPDLSVITSTYRAQPHLPGYIAAVQPVLGQVMRAGIQVELIIVANDATADERRQLDVLAAGDRFPVRVIHTPRETVYASWNRGIAAAAADVVTFWAVDDRRTAEALLEGCELIRSGCELVDTPFTQVHDNRRVRFPAAYDPSVVTPRHGVGPFFLLTRDLYARAGAFHPAYRISGDFEWATRPPVRSARCCVTRASGGDFMRHADNLSGGSDPMEWVEFNITLIWRGEFGQLRPVDPVLMRQAWAQWGAAGCPDALPAPVAEWLWGAGAQQRYAAYQRDRRLPDGLRRVRQALSRRGLLPDIEARFRCPHP